MGDVVMILRGWTVRGLAALAVAWAVRGASAETRVLWPSPDVEVRAQRDSQLSVLADGAALVRTGTGYAWPGLRFDFAKGPCDLSAYGVMTVSVSNALEKTVRVMLSVKSQALQGRSPGGKVVLPPHGTGELVVRLDMMPWRLDEPLDIKGMNGFPVARGGVSHAFDLSRTVSVHVFRGGASESAAFAVRRVAVSERTVAQKVLKTAGFLPFVDRYGQFAHDDWPGKVHDDAELAAAREDEARWLAANERGPRTDVDRFGGWAAGPQLAATGYFRTEKVNGKWWLVDPEGRLFFSHGVDCVSEGGGDTGIGGREAYFAWLPDRSDSAFGAFWGEARRPAAHGFYAQTNNLPYATYSFFAANMVRKYGADWRAACRDLAHRRLRAWGHNTIANWSQREICLARRTPYTLCLGTHGAPRLAGSKGWWGPLPDPFNPVFERLLRKQARAAAARMREDPMCLGIFVDNELSWNDLPNLDAVAEQYFKVVSGIIHEELPHHLYLGCRIAWGTDGVYRIAAKYCDVVSVNIYDRTPTRDLPAGCEDKPMINGEFHFGALDRGLFHPGLVATADQGERAQCYRDFVIACLDHPRLVGTHWFQYHDQPLTGRSDGENYQIGFLTVTDAPYPELVEAARDVARGMYERRYGAVPQVQSQPSAK